jgi:hypothetical protein
MVVDMSFSSVFTLLISKFSRLNLSIVLIGIVVRVYSYNQVYIHLYIVIRNKTISVESNPDTNQ